MLIIELFWKDKINYWTKSHQTIISILTRQKDVTKEEKYPGTNIWGVYCQ